MYKNSRTPHALGFKCLMKYKYKYNNSLVCFCCSSREISVGIESGLRAGIPINRGSIPDGD
jgi:hypothetical protein